MKLHNDTAEIFVPDGVPVEFGMTWFAGERVTLTLGEDA